MSKRHTQEGGSMTNTDATKHAIVVQNGDDFLNEPPTRPEHGSRWGDWVLNLEPEDNPSLDYVGKWYRHNPYWIVYRSCRRRRG